MVTEADARVLEYGSTIVLVAGGHVTPLAQDTLRARRITVVARRRRRRTSAALAPAADIRTVAIAGDHTSLALKAAHRAAPARPRPRGARPRHRRPAIRWTIRTPPRPRPCRWRAAKPTPASSSTAPGLGSTIAANKVAGARAAMCLNETLARYARQHNGANVLALGLHAGHRGRGAGDRRHVSSTRRCARRATSAGWPRFATSRRVRAADGSRRPPAADPDHRRGAGGGPGRAPRRRAARCHAVLYECCPDRLRGVLEAGRDAARPARLRRRRRRRGRR